MRYKPLGNTGISFSTLGLGAMRLPGFEVDNVIYNHDKEEQAIQIAHRAFELGVNNIDTAYIYAQGHNEKLVGQILKSWRDKIYVSTKCPTYLIKERGDFRRFLEEELTRLDRDYIDIYYFHGLDDEIWDDIGQKYSLEKEALKAKEEGLIRHIGFSSHDKKLKRLLDTGLFETILVQYNILDRRSLPDIQYAFEKGIGVSVMGPVAGGRLSWPSAVMNHYLQDEKDITATTAQIALRFVMGDPCVTCTLSGMVSIEMVEENAKLASMEHPLDDTTLNKINIMTEQTKRLKDLYCTGCNYCSPCPQGINISYVFQQMIYHDVYGLKDVAENGMKSIGKEESAGQSPLNCIACGLCEKRCPQNIKISDQIKQANDTFKHILQN